VAKRGRPKKNKFADLPVGFAESMSSSNDEEIRKQISECAMTLAAVRIAKANDLDLKEKVQAAKEAGAVYRDQRKEHELKIEFCRSVLKDRGRDVPGHDIVEM
jgi:hypothetical protein